MLLTRRVFRERQDALFRGRQVPSAVLSSSRRMISSIVKSMILLFMVVLTSFSPISKPPSSRLTASVLPFSGSVRETALHEAKNINKINSAENKDMRFMVFVPFLSLIFSQTVVRLRLFLQADICLRKPPPNLSGLSHLWRLRPAFHCRPSSRRCRSNKARPQVCRFL